MAGPFFLPPPSFSLLIAPALLLLLLHVPRIIGACVAVPFGGLTVRRSRPDASYFCCARPGIGAH
eukprot:3922597-Pyramimonas_sp.AAC.1